MADLNRREWARAAASGVAAMALADVTPAFAQVPATAGGARDYRYVHLDVFTDQRLAGNPLLVYVNPEGLDVDTMTRITLESNYSENTFVFAPDAPGTDFRVRIFTREGEVPIAGHPTVGTAFALAHVGRLKAGQMKTVFALGVGPTPIDLEWNGSQLAFAWMTQLRPTFGKAIADAAGVAAVIGLHAGDIVTSRGPAAQDVSTGSNWIIVPLATRKAVDAAVLDGGRMDALRTANGLTGRGVYVFTTQKAADDATSYSRLLGGPADIEDPATGSAAGPAGCFMLKYGFVPPDRAGSMINLQGMLVKRPSRISVNVATSSGDIVSVKVGGSSVVIAEGTMFGART
jgi:trans-2,3-dihydro-3-hydroxyanthranilate isomerase